jgi:hypothetical protein
VKVGLTYCHPSGQATSAIDYVLYQEKHESEVLKIQKLDVVANVSDPYFHSAQLMVRYKIIDIFFSLRLNSFYYIFIEISANNDLMGIFVGFKYLV